MDPENEQQEPLTPDEVIDSDDPLALARTVEEAALEGWVDEEVDDTPLTDITAPTRAPTAKSVDELNRMELVRKCVVLRMSGLTYDQIGAIVGRSRQWVSSAVKTAAAEAVSDDVETLKAIHYQRLEHIIMVNWAGVTAKDGQATAAVFGAMDRLERLMGYTAASSGPGAVGAGSQFLADGTKEEFIAAMRQARQALKQASAPEPAPEQHDTSAATQETSDQPQ